MEVEKNNDNILFIFHNDIFYKLFYTKPRLKMRINFYNRIVQ